MRTLLALFLILPLTVQGQAIWRNFFVTNQNPRVTVVAGSNATVQASTVGVDQRIFTVNAIPGDSANSTNFWGVLSPTNLPPGLSTSNYVGTFTGNGAGLTNFPQKQIVIATTNSPAQARAVAAYLCTGTADEVQFKQAITNVSPDIYVSPGNYWFGATCRVTNNNVVITGGGSSTILNFAPQASKNQSVFDFRYSTNILIKNLLVNGQSELQPAVSDQNVECLQFMQCQDVTIQDCDIGNAWQALNCESVGRILVEGNRIHTQTNVGHLLNFDSNGAGAPPCTDIKLINNFIYDVGTNACKAENCVGFMMSGNSVSNYVLVPSNRPGFVFGPNDVPVEALNRDYLITANAFYSGIQFEVTDTNANLHFIGNSVRNGILNCVGNSAAPFQPRNITIENNEFFDCGGTVSAITLADDYAYGFISIQNNVVINCSTGIRLNSTNLSLPRIIGNRITLNTNAAGYGIVFRSSLADVSNNRIYWPTPTNNSAGIFAEDGSGTNMIKGNSIIGAYSGIVLEGSSSNSVSDNFILYSTKSVWEQAFGSVNCNYNQIWNNQLNGIAVVRDANQGILDNTFSPSQPYAWQYQFCGAGVNATPGTATRYFSITGSQSANTETNVRTPVSKGGVLSTLYVHLASTQGAGTNYTYTIFTNGVSTGVSCVVIAGNSTSNDLTNSTVAFPDGTGIAIGISCNYTNPTANNYYTWSFVIK